MPKQKNVEASLKHVILTEKIDERDNIRSLHPLAKSYYTIVVEVEGKTMYFTSVREYWDLPKSVYIDGLDES